MSRSVFKRVQGDLVDIIDVVKDLRLYFCNNVIELALIYAIRDLLQHVFLVHFVDYLLSLLPLALAQNGECELWSEGRLCLLEQSVVRVLSVVAHP